MKNSLTLVFLFFNHLLLFGQMPTSNSSRDCANYNSFLDSEDLELLTAYTTAISPTGILTFDGSMMEEIDGIEDLFPLLEIDNNTGFELLGIHQSRLNENHIYSQYQQTYNGIAVEGGGITTVTYGEYHTGGDPCDKLVALSSYLISGVTDSTIPSISEEALKTIIKDHSGIAEKERLELNSNLMISSMGRNNCEFGLSWKSRYVIQGDELTYVDAHTGEVLNSQEQFMGLTAPTELFGTVDLLDTENNNVTELIYSNGNTVVKSYDFNGAPLVNDPPGPHQFTNDLIPSTSHTHWTEAESSKNVYQAHHVVTRCLPAFQSLGINFSSLDVGANFVGNGAYVRSNPAEMKGSIHFGEKEGVSYALHDVAAHEMGHIYVGNFMDYTTVETASIHEAYADMLGTFAEYYVKGDANWWMGDEASVIQSSVFRNLADPEYHCLWIFIQHPIGAYPHDRSQPLSHWFYLLSQGFNSGGVHYPGVGIEVALDIALEMLYMVGPQGDYKELREAAAQLLYEHYGPCSVAMHTASAAFKKICMLPFDYPLEACFDISGQDYRCEEWTTSYNLCPINAPLGQKYRWKIEDGQGVNWTASNGTQSGNSFITGPNQPCLYINYIPDYNHYPRQIKISAYPMEHGPAYRQVKRLKLDDCDGSSDPCNGTGINQEPGIDEFSVRAIKGESTIHSIKVYDLMGRTLFSGAEDDLDFQVLDISGIVLLSYFNKQGELLTTTKQFIKR